ncbi:DUF7563 family protein [Halolamina sediminis]|uniref:DUF7563 family protein n=1 Tax=Halolamina sediminis TaxID=1480675 RepID=UPI0006B63496|nr:hypothetical protein [Halolamina sediminis]
MTPLEYEASHSDCRFCGAHVSTDFRRTFGDEQNVAHRCLSCDSRPRVQAGSAAGVSVDYPDPAEQEFRNRGPRVAATDGGVSGGGGR